MAFPLATRRDVVQEPHTIAAIERRLQQCLASYRTAASPDMRDRMRKRIDQLLDERNEITAALG